MSILEILVVRFQNLYTDPFIVLSWSQFMVAGYQKLRILIIHN